MEKTLHRSRTNRVISGVAGGLGEYFDIDPTLVRVGFVLLFFSGGFGLLLYIALIFVIPEEGQVATETPAGKLKKEFDKGSTHDIKVANTTQRQASQWLAFGLILIGVLFLLDSLNLLRALLPNYRLGQLWPLVIIFLGLWLLFRRRS